MSFSLSSAQVVYLYSTEMHVENCDKLCSVETPGMSTVFPSMGYTDRYLDMTSCCTVIQIYAFPTKAHPCFPCHFFLNYLCLFTGLQNLPIEADRLFLYERFAPFGAILSVKVLTDAETGGSRVGYK